MNFVPGDIIERIGPLATKHRGVFAGWDFFGRAVVIHNAKNDSVRRDLFETFAAGLPVTVVSRIARNMNQQEMIVGRAESLLGTKFDLWNFNCDHLVTYALAGVASSPQLQVIAGIACLAIVAAFAARS